MEQGPPPPQLFVDEWMERILAAAPRERDELERHFRAAQITGSCPCGVCRSFFLHIAIAEGLNPLRPATQYSLVYELAWRTTGEEEAGMRIWCDERGMLCHIEIEYGGNDPWPSDLQVLELIGCWEAQ